MGSSSSAPIVDLTEKERKKCVVLQSSRREELKGLRKLGVEIVCVEVVVHVRPDDGGMVGEKKPPPPDTSAVETATAAGTEEETVANRVARVAILTRGTVHIDVKKRLRKRKDRVEKYPNVLISIRNLRAVRHIRGSDLVVLSSWNDGGDTEFAMYQTPEPSRFLRRLSETLVAAHAGVPDWAVPARWNVGFALPQVSIEDYKTFLGADGGFSSAFFSSALATLVRAHVAIGTLSQGPSHIAGIISDQQPPQPFPRSGPQCLDVVKLVNTLPGGSSSSSSVRFSLIIGALGCLPFNLVFRKLFLRDATFPSAQQRALFGRDLARVLLYNVTIREIDLSGTSLEGLGEDLGQGLAMNIQPLFSGLNLSRCRLSDRDLRGLVPGLARLWCGGSAWPELVVLADNPGVTQASWNVLFDSLVDPSTIPFWPVSPPPAPSLAYLQNLDVRGTSAAGPGLARLVAKLSGLRSIGIGSTGSASGGGVDLVLQALAELDAPLETFVGECMDGSCATALFRHCGTLRSVTFLDFRGDATPLLCSWLEPVPKLSVEFKGNCREAVVLASDGQGYAPSSLVLRDASFGRHAIKLLSTQATGLKSLYVHGMHYSDLSEAVPMFACSGLATLHIHPTDSSQRPPRPSASVERTSFWQLLATSKTLEDLQMPNQLSNGTGELVMIGGFLKANRSVRRINFDGTGFSLDVEGVKALRSAFYGNKKVIAMKYLRDAHARTLKESKEITEAQLREVQACKREIKRIFKQHYSKYNRNWRDRPNKLKLPYVERIRVAKRKIGSIERDMAKIARLLNEINECITANQRGYEQIQQEKENVKLARRQGQLEGISRKKQKFMTTLVTKLHKAKQQGRKGKSGKNQVPRSTYYKDKKLWPAKNIGRSKAPSSHYRYWNDPYNARFHYGYGYYGYGYNGWWHNPVEVCDSTSEEGSQSDAGGEEPGSGEGAEGEGQSEEANPLPPPFVLDGDVVPEGFPDGGASAEENEWECIPVQDNLIELMVPPDPWNGMDGLVQSADSNAAVALTPDFLSEIHREAAELGPDVVAELAPVLDSGAAVDAKIDAIADSMAVDRGLLSGVIDSSMDENFDLGALESELGEIDEYVAGADEFAAGADDVVEMYAGAGPRDLDDGGPSFGGASSAALAGARRRARTRKANRIQRRIRSSVACRGSIGYRSLTFPTSEHSKALGSSFDSWPDDLVDSLMQELRATQIDAMSKSNLFPLPDVANEDPERIFEWDCSHDSNLVVNTPIEVILITQCSLDRLPKLQEQLVAWKGKTSVAVYVKHSMDMGDAKKVIAAHVGEAKRRALESCDGAPHWDVALTVVQDTSDDAPYPINFLRNAALLEARYQQRKSRGCTAKSAALLVDVDFRPSDNLHRLFHCEAAVDAILEQQRVVVCPAFECGSGLVGNASPRSIPQLRHCIDNGKAEGFHLSHFPQGHEPTRFDQFWRHSLNAASEDDLWKTAYDISYQESFEPYVVMAIDTVPLCDERFQGYGLNKVSHLASIAQQTSKGFLVLPGVFLVAAAHERSESWSRIYGSASDEAKFNKLWLKGLYQNFCLRLNEGRDPMVSRRTKVLNEELKTHLVDEAKKVVPFVDEKLLSLILPSVASTGKSLVSQDGSQWEGIITLRSGLCLVQT